jgi:hypothetical protein
MKHELQSTKKYQSVVHISLSRNPSEKSAPTDTNPRPTTLSGLSFHFNLIKGYFCGYLMFTVQIRKMLSKRKDLCSPFLNRTSAVMIPHNCCHQYQYLPTNYKFADPGGRTVYRMGQRRLGCSNCGSESRREHGCLSLVIVVFFKQYCLRRADPSSRE